MVRQGQYQNNNFLIPFLFIYLRKQDLIYYREIYQNK